MFTSTLRRSAHAKAIRRGVTAWLTFVAIIGACAPANSSQRDSRRESSGGLDEFRRAKPLIVSALQDQPDLPSAEASIRPLQKAPRWSSDSEGRRLLISINFRYKGLTNSYCRLATLPDNFQTANLVPLPSSANSEDCASIADVIYLDINQDNILDIVQSLHVKSNRYETMADVIVVYLSNTNEKSGYCYSEQVSRLLSAAKSRSSFDMKRTIENERKRLLISKFDCSQ